MQAANARTDEGFRVCGGNEFNRTIENGCKYSESSDIGILHKIVWKFWMMIVNMVILCYNFFQ